MDVAGAERRRLVQDVFHQPHDRCRVRDRMKRVRFLDHIGVRQVVDEIRELLAVARSNGLGYGGGGCHHGINVSAGAEAGFFQGDPVQGIRHGQAQSAVAGREGQDRPGPGEGGRQEGECVGIRGEGSFEEGEEELRGQRPSDGHVVDVASSDQNVPKATARSEPFRQGRFQLSAVELPRIHQELPEGLRSHRHGGVWSRRPGV